MNNFNFLLDVCTLKFLPNGLLICNDLKTWDLLLLEQIEDKSWVERKRIAGIGSEVPGYFRFMRTRVSDDTNYFLWARGESDISIVDASDFSARHIHNFWNFRGQNAKAATVALDSSATKVVGIGFIEGQNDIQTMHVYDGRDGVTAFEAADILDDEVQAWISLEVSLDGQCFFIGGASNRDFAKGDAYIAALEFDENADLVAFKKFGGEYGLHAITSLRRHPERDLVFAGCYGWLAVLLWAGNEFHFINKIKNVIPAPISDIDVKLNKQAIYTVCDHIQGMAIYFDPNFIRSRDPIKNSTAQKPLPQDYNSKAYSTYYSNSQSTVGTSHFNVTGNPKSTSNRNPMNPAMSTIKDIY